jgi:hypothetical protein
MMEDALGGLAIGFILSLPFAVAIARIADRTWRAVACITAFFGLCFFVLQSFIAVLSWLAITMVLVSLKKISWMPVVVVYFSFTAAITLGFMVYAAAKQRYYEQKFPIESLEHRLAYEPAEHEPVEHVSVERERATDRFFNIRGYSLEKIHDNYAAVFIQAAGFGNVRMLQVTAGLHDQKSPPLHQPAAEKAQDPGTIPGMAPNEKPLTPPTDDLARFQETATELFTNDDDWGYIKAPRKAVAGFTAHRFRADRPVDESTPRAWRLERLELVSLLKFKEPRVYRSEYLPNMDELRDAPTRALDEFEATALPKLRPGKEDIIAEVRGPYLRMLGRVDFRAECGNCHHRPRDGLLGAFSYRFGR